MSEANVIFTLDGIDITIQCSQEDKMSDICQKYGAKLNLILIHSYTYTVEIN